MTPEQRIEILEQNSSRMLGLISGLTAAVVTLINTHPDRALVGRLLDHSANFGVKAGTRSGLPSENLEFFSRLMASLHATATGTEAADLGEAERVIQEVLRKIDENPDG